MSRPERQQNVLDYGLTPEEIKIVESASAEASARRREAEK
jgi:hypothetical protein